MSELQSKTDDASEATNPKEKASPAGEEQASVGAKSAGLTAIVVVMILFLRIMAVSNWNWETAAELADAFNFDDAVPIFFGTLFELPLLTGLAAGLILPLAIYRLYIIGRTPAKFAKITDWLVILLLVIVMFVLMRSYEMWWPIALAVVLSIAIGTFAYFVHKGEALDLLDDASRRTGTLMVVVLLLLSVVVTTPWNPREEIGLKDRVIHGHIVDVTPGFVKVLTDEREVVVLLTPEVVSRKTVGIEE